MTKIKLILLSTDKKIKILRNKQLKEKINDAFKKLYNFLRIVSDI